MNSRKHHTPNEVLSKLRITYRLGGQPRGQRYCVASRRIGRLSGALQGRKEGCRYRLFFSGLAYVLAHLNHGRQLRHPLSVCRTVSRVPEPWEIIFRKNSRSFSPHQAFGTLLLLLLIAAQDMIMPHLRRFLKTRPRQSYQTTPLNVSENLHHTRSMLLLLPLPLPGDVTLEQP